MCYTTGSTTDGDFSTIIGVSTEGTELTDPDLIAEYNKIRSVDSKYGEEMCLHDSCPDCGGTGIKKWGGACIHFISCPCPKCSPRF